LQRRASLAKIGLAKIGLAKSRLAKSRLAKIMADMGVILEPFGGTADALRHDMGT
jgi:hypothetical protein